MAARPLAVLGVRPLYFAGDVDFFFSQFSSPNPQVVRSIDNRFCRMFDGDDNLYKKAQLTPRLARDSPATWRIRLK